MVYIVRVILPDGKNKMVVEEEHDADNYEKDINNNLVLWKDQRLVVEYHTYNWLSIKPKEDASVTS
jgi:hypothetical protein